MCINNVLIFDSTNLVWVSLQENASSLRLSCFRSVSEPMTPSSSLATDTSKQCSLESHQLVSRYVENYAGKVAAKNRSPLNRLNELIIAWQRDSSTCGTLPACNKTIMCDWPGDVYAPALFTLLQTNVSHLKVHTNRCESPMQDHISVSRASGPGVVTMSFQCRTRPCTVRSAGCRETRTVTHSFPHAS